MIETGKLDREATLDPSEVPERDRARLLSLDQCIPLLASPDGHEALTLTGDRRTLVTDGTSFPIIDGLPLLFPSALQPYIGSTGLEVPAGGSDALRKYVHLSSLKFDRELRNCHQTDVDYRKHLHRSRQLLRNAGGTVLDVGCDSPAISRALFPSTAQYIGLEPTYEDRSEFRIIGMAEFLPFRNSCLDNVALMTTLDHILDYQTAIDEAWRVLKPGGILYLGTLVWTHDAQLYHDHIHFHHFRDFEILGALNSFSIQELRRYPWKGNDHRFGWYLSASK